MNILVARDTALRLKMHTTSDLFRLIQQQFYFLLQACIERRMHGDSVGSTVASLHKDPVFNS